MCVCVCVGGGGGGGPCCNSSAIIPSLPGAFIFLKCIKALATSSNVDGSASSFATGYWGTFDKMLVLKLLTMQMLACYSKMESQYKVCPHHGCMSRPCTFWEEDVSLIISLPFQ